jgi:hypothetical protein
MFPKKATLLPSLSIRNLAMNKEVVGLPWL